MSPKKAFDITVTSKARKKDYILTIEANCLEEAMSIAQFVITDTIDAMLKNPKQTFGSLIAVCEVGDKKMLDPETVVSIQRRPTSSLGTKALARRQENSTSVINGE